MEPQTTSRPRSNRLSLRLPSARSTAIFASLIFCAYLFDQLGYSARILQLKCPPTTTKIPATNGPATSTATVEVTLESQHNSFHFDDERFPFVMTIRNKHHKMPLPRGTSFRFVPPMHSNTFRGHLLYELESELQAGQSHTAIVHILQDHRPQNISYIQNFPEEFSVLMQVRNQAGKYEDQPTTYTKFSFNTTMFMGEIIRSIQCSGLKSFDQFRKQVIMFGPTGCHKTTMYCLLKNSLSWGRCDEDIMLSPRHVTHALKSYEFEIGYGYRLCITDNIGNTDLSNKFSERILQGQIPEGVNITSKAERSRFLHLTRGFDVDLEREPSKYLHMFPKVMLYIMTIGSMDDPQKIEKMDTLFKLAGKYGISPALVITDYDHYDQRHNTIFKNWYSKHTRYSYYRVNTPRQANERASIPFKEAKVWLEILQNSLSESCGRSKRVEFKNERSNAYDCGCGLRILEQTNIWSYIAAIWEGLWSVPYQKFLYMLSSVISMF